MPSRRLQLRGVDLLPVELVGDRQHVGRRHHDDVGLEVDDQLHLALSEPAADRDYRGAEMLAAVVRAKPAGEQAVAIGDMDLVAPFAAGRADRARHQGRPGFDVGLGIADHRRLARRAARCVDAHDVVHRHGEHPERIVLPQVVLGRERKPDQVGKRPEIARMHACGVKRLPVVRHALVGARQRAAQAHELQGPQFIDACLFDRFELIAAGHDAHSVRSNECPR